MEERSGSGVAQPAPSPVPTTPLMWPVQSSVCEGVSVQREPTYTRTDVSPSQSVLITHVSSIVYVRYQSVYIEIC